MTEFKFQWQKFKMESSAKDFLEKYILFQEILIHKKDGITKCKN